MAEQVSGEVLGIPRTHYDALIAERDRLARELEQYKHDAHALLAVNRQAIAGLDMLAATERELGAYKRAVEEMPINGWLNGVTHANVIRARVTELMKGVDDMQ